MNRWTLLLLPFLISCAQPVAYKDARGKTNYFVSCSQATGMAYCYKQAAKQCPSGFTTLDRSDRGSDIVNAAGHLSPKEMDYNLTIACN